MRYTTRERKNRNVESATFRFRSPSCPKPFIKPRTQDICNPGPFGNRSNLVPDSTSRTTTAESSKTRLKTGHSRQAALRRGQPEHHGAVATPLDDTASKRCSYEHTMLSEPGTRPPETCLHHGPACMHCPAYLPNDQCMGNS
jgi:hypothetical protein